MVEKPGDGGNHDFADIAFLVYLGKHAVLQ